MVTHSLDDKIKTDLLEQQTGQGVLEHRLAEFNIVPELSVLQFLIKVSDGGAESVAENALGSAGGFALSPDGLKLKSGVVTDGVLDLLHVCLVELGGGAVLANAHVLDEAFVVEGQRSQNLKRGRGNTTLVG